MSVEIYHFFMFLRNPVFWYLFQMAWNGSSNKQNTARVTFCDAFLIMRLIFTNIKHLTIYIKEKRKLHFSHHIWCFMCFAGLTCPQDHSIFDWTPCVVSLSFLFSDAVYLGNIITWKGYYRNIFLLAWYVSCAWKLFFVSCFCYQKLSCFHAAIWDITVCSPCRKQSEYFDKADVARFQTCYTDKGAFRDNSLQFDPTNSHYHKDLHRRLGVLSKVYLFQ